MATYGNNIEKLITKAKISRESFNEGTLSSLDWVELCNAALELEGEQYGFKSQPQSKFQKPYVCESELEARKKQRKAVREQYYKRKSRE